jgi:hypothetical protein
MVAPLMQSSELYPYYISRNAFQWILHQSLVADERHVFCGLIGADSESLDVIEKVAMVKDVTDVVQTLAVWQELGIPCLGFFHFENEVVHQELVQAMSEQHTKLDVRLAEKGRLDLLAFQCQKESGSVVKINLDLIEDGHAASVV